MQVGHADRVPRVRVVLDVLGVGVVAVVEQDGARGDAVGGPVVDAASGGAVGAWFDVGGGCLFFFLIISIENCALVWCFLCMCVYMYVRTPL